MASMLAITLSAGGAGAVSVNVAAAATYAENTMGGSLVATIDNSTVNSTGGAILVDASADNLIQAFGLAVGLSFGGAGGASFNVAMAGVGATNTTTIGLTEAMAGLLFTPSAKSMFAFGILVLVLLFRPQGILGKKTA